MSCNHEEMHISHALGAAWLLLRAGMAGPLRLQHEGHWAHGGWGMNHQQWDFNDHNQEHCFAGNGACLTVFKNKSSLVWFQRNTV